MPDRIEAGTYLVAAAITNSVLTINNIVPKHLENILKVLMKFGVQFKINKKNDLKISPKIRKPINVTTAPYPGFPTDMQAQIMSLLVLTKGTSNIKEDIFENRFLHVSELNRMGANIKIENNKAKIIGTNVLSGAEVLPEEYIHGCSKKSPRSPDPATVSSPNDPFNKFSVCISKSLNNLPMFANGTLLIVVLTSVFCEAVSIEFLSIATASR